MSKAVSIKLRAATLADLALLRRWDEQEHVVAADPNDDWAWEVELARHPDWREQLIAEADGRPVGFVQIIDPRREETHYWGDVPANLRAIYRALLCRRLGVGGAHRSAREQRARAALL